MLTNIVDTIRKEKASFARNVEYLKETAMDDMIDERMEVAESQYARETIDELTEAADMVNRLSSEEDLVAESTEVDKILNAEQNLTFNEMVGIE